MPRIDISKANRAEVLMYLFNAGVNWGAVRDGQLPALGAILQGLTGRMTLERAERILQRQVDFDYIDGRSFIVNMQGPIVDLWLYERDAGEGTARRALHGIAGVEFLD